LNSTYRKDSEAMGVKGDYIDVGGREGEDED
jgi:hypothetical protein